MIGIVVAMQDELRTLLWDLKKSKEREIRGRKVWTGELSGKSVVIVQSGMGKVNAAAGTELLLAEFGVHFVVNFGCAGAMDPSVGFGDMIVSTSSVQTDVDFTSFGHLMGEVPGVGREFISSINLRTFMSQAACNLGFGERMKYGQDLTSDKFIGTAELREEVLSRFSGFCCDMEGAAVAQVCHLSGVEFVLLKGISDSASDNAAAQFEGSVEDLSVELQDVLKEFIRIV